MDVCNSKNQLQKHTEVGTPRPPLVPAERNNGITSHRPQRRDISSRYRSPSPSPSTTSAPRRCQSPTSTRTLQTNSQSTTKRAHSAERKRPSTPSSPPSPSSTPVKDSSTDIQISSRKVLSGRLPDGLWPSTMRSLSVSFQSDSNSVPVSKKEPVTCALSEHPLRPSSNVHKQVEKPTVARKSTPERKRNPLIGKNVPDQSENSKPVDGLPSRLMDQHRWPSRTSGKVSSNSLARRVDAIDKTDKTSISSVSGNKASSVRRLSVDGVVKPPQKTTGVAARLLSIEDRVRIGLQSVDDNHLQVSVPKKPVPEKSLDKVTPMAPTVRSQSSHASISCPSSPSKTSALSASACRGVDPSQTTLTRGMSPSAVKQSNPARGISPAPARQTTPARGISPTPARPSTPARGISPTPARSSAPARGTSPIPARPSTHVRGTSPSPARPSTPARGASPIPARPSTSVRGTSPSPARPSTPRGTSPSRIRASNSSNQTSSSASVLSFIADFRNGRKSASYIEDAHQLRLVYNRYLQWRFANAQADAVLHIKNVNAERSLYNVWDDTQALCDTVILKRIELQKLRLELKLNSILNGQMDNLDDWALLEAGHASSLSGAVKDFEACTLRLPVTGGARVDIESLKLAICSAVDVMQTMGSSICSLLSQVEMMNNLVSQLAFVTLQENDMLDQCESLLASTAAMQVEEHSLSIHLMQMRQASDNKLCD